MRNANLDPNGDDIRHSPHGDVDTDADEYGDANIGAEYTNCDAHTSPGDCFANASAEHT